MDAAVLLKPVTGDDSDALDAFAKEKARRPEDEDPNMSVVHRRLSTLSVTTVIVP